MLGYFAKQELRPTTRLPRMQMCLRAYCVLLILEALLYYLLFLLEYLDLLAAGLPVPIAVAGDFVARFFTTIVKQHLLLVCLLTPALAAGVIADEKTRGNLSQLLVASVNSAEIVLGKLIGRLAQLGWFLLAPLPFIVVLVGFSGAQPFYIPAFIALNMVVAGSLASVAALSSVACRRARDATIAAYLILAVLSGAVLGSNTWHAINPLGILDGISSSNDPLFILSRMGSILLPWCLLGVVCVGGAIAGLRPVYRREMDAEGKVPRRHWWSRPRPTVADDPISWKEEHVERLLPFMPRVKLAPSISLVAAFLVGLTSTGVILAAFVPQTGWLSIISKLQSTTSVGKVIRGWGPMSYGFFLQGLAVAILSSMVVCLRSSFGVSKERDNDTWEALLLTPLEAAEIIRGKFVGIVRQFRPALVAFALPTIAVASLGGVSALLPVVSTLCLTWSAVAFFAALGLWWSTILKNSWQSLLATLFSGYVAWAFLYLGCLAVVGVGFISVFFVLSLVDAFMASGAKYADLLEGRFLPFSAGWCASMAIAFWGCSGVLLRWAARHIAEHHRPPHRPKRSRRRSPRLPVAGALSYH